ncbi:hypothetical protein MHA_1024 [Mannheimia haemolytica PHL213]|nr:hypothetical protein MHA_1024 [Mannheimia haemolytica PHL213]
MACSEDIFRKPEMANAIQNRKPNSNPFGRQLLKGFFIA